MKIIIILLFVYSGITSANNNLSQIFLSENKQHALNELLPFAKKGNSEAQYYVSLLYSHGKGIKTNSKKALDYMWLAAEQGDQASIRMLATFYFTGNNTEKNVGIAYKLYLKLAESGDRDAQILLGALLTDGKFYDKNLIEGVSWLIAANNVTSLKGKALNNYNNAINLMSPSEINQSKTIASKRIKSLTNSSSRTTNP